MDIKSIVAQMTLEEKCSLFSGADFWHTRGVDRLGVKPVMVSDGPHGLRKQPEGSDHLGINDSIKAVCYPAACAGAASFDRDVMKRVGEAIGIEAQHEKLAVVLGPAVNIKRSPLCGRNFEYYSEDPYLTAELSTAYIKGIQSKNVGACIKHFAANSQENRRMSSDSVVDARTLREIYLPAFENAVKQGDVWSVMCSYNRINGVFSSMNKWLLNDLLRDEWGFDGYVMTDWGAVTDRVEGVKAGLDLEMPGSGGMNDKLVMEAVQAGKLDEALVDKCVENLLRVNERYLANAKPETEWDMEAQHKETRELEGECMVLLKNVDGVLPFPKTGKTAVIGAFAKTPRYQGGGSSHINSFRVDSLLDALEGMEGITYAQGYEAEKNEPDEKLIAEAVEAAKNADRCVIVAGLPDSFESEGYDRAHMRMPDSQIELIKAVGAANPDTVVVLYNGSPVEMPWLDSVKGVIEAYIGGQAVGAATADVLFGDVNPSGRLPETFTRRLEDTSAYLTYGGEGDSAVYTEGVFVGYRYYDRKKTDVLFPFGYGLSYTSFEYSDLCVSADSIKDTDTVTVTVKVKNTGKRAGKEVVQLYVGDRVSEVFRPVRELKGFDKIYLEPGEEKTVTFTLDKRAFAYWREDIHDWYVESGDFAIEIARSSRDVILARNVYVESTAVLPRHYTMNSIFKDIFADPKAMAVMKPLLDGFARGFGGGEAQDGDAAVTADMMNAFLMYAPLRGLVSFSQGALKAEMLQAMLDQIND